MNKLVIFLVALIPLLLMSAIPAQAIKLTTVQEACIRMALSSLVNDTLNNTDFGPSFRIDTTMNAIDVCLT